ncbi:phage major capsid protein [Sporanaerobium hydrogeniformans]|uniref:Phage major capsid protein n=1 Tax=Sporanaerobium hydrogeniformans TaxID=3072179 RepID=A0AC61DG35_9FIRM|nr:phage major capsid protein [Sporanaerobium hydrogeniformans]PHV71907.1 phage major capsid protein [Sporanaerobium hydrogeniformans]
MALKQLMLSKKIEAKRAVLNELQTEFTVLEKREAEATAAIEEASTEEEMKIVEEEVEAVDKAKEELEGKKAGLEEEIRGLEAELEELNKKGSEESEQVQGQQRKSEYEKGVEVRMRNTGFFKGISTEARNAFLKNEAVKEFLQRAREFKSQTRAVTGAELNIPDVALELLRDNLHRYSKLIGKVRLKPVAGKARQNIAGTIPEGVWMEAVGTLNELTMKFTQVEMDGYKVGGFIPVPNSTLEDSDINLANEIMDALGQAIGYAIDKAIIYGTGTKMPLGIATRLAQTLAPSNWGTHAPTWVNLSVSNVLKIDGTTLVGAEFFSELILNLGKAKANYSDGTKFWAMNSTTKAALMAKAIAFNAAGAIVSAQNNTMPIIGGEIIELEFMRDNDICGGYGSLYTLAERAGASLAVSDQVKFIEDQTVFKGTARYDGMPVIGEGFVMVNFNNVVPTTSLTFAEDVANKEGE